MTTSRYAEWLKINNEKIFFWHHVPKNNIKAAAIIFIGPIGPEYMSCHRSIKLLSEKLAQSGFHSIRYDPLGMGNSSGNLEDSGLWNKWLNTPTAINNHLFKKFNINETIFIALRSGCLILSEVLKKTPVKAAILWYPHTKGKAFIRSIQLLDSVLYKKDISPTNYAMEGGGYPFSVETQNKIKNIKLSDINIDLIENILTINSADLSNKTKTPVWAKVKDDQVYLDGLDNMVKQVTLSTIPHSNIDFITNWVNQLKIGSSINPHLHTNHTTNYEHEEYKETIININTNNKIFSVLTTPTYQDLSIIMVFVNTGAAHHVGPNHIHVDTARALAKYGVSTLRIDISNLGDSAVNYHVDPPNEYPLSATQDINSTIDYIDKYLPHKKIALCGISAGAHNIFHAALNSSSNKLSQLIIINPETFYYKQNDEHTMLSSQNPQTEIDQVYYQSQFLNFKKWGALLTNPKKIYTISCFMLFYTIKKVKNITLKLLNLLNLRIKTVLEKDLELLWYKNISITLIYSQGDPGHQILISQAGDSIKKYTKKNLFSSIRINNADHTFSSIRSRECLYTAITKSIIESNDISQ